MRKIDLSTKAMVDRGFERVAYYRTCAIVLGVAVVGLALVAGCILVRLRRVARRLGQLEYVFLGTI